MKIVKVPVAELHPAEYNPRKDLQPGDRQYDKLARSMEAFGYVEPIVWNSTTGNVVGGHQRLKVLLAQGVTEVDVVEVELPEKEEKILNVALNKIAGRWDNGKLVSLLEELKEAGEMEDTGFDDWELESLQVTYDHIQDLMEEDFTAATGQGPDSFTMTFTLPAEAREAMDRYIEENPAARTDLSALVIGRVKGVL